MNHDEAEREEAALHFVLGQLDEVKAAAFEEHFLDCPRCLAELQLAESLVRGLRRAAAEDPPAASSAARHLAIPRQRRPFFLLAAASAMLALACGWLAFTTWQKRQELQSLRAELADRPSAEQLANAEERAQAAEEAVVSPRAGVLLATLSPLRGEATPPRFLLDSRQTALLLALDLGPKAGDGWQIELHAKGEAAPRWQGGPFASDIYGELMIDVPRAFLKPGSWQLDARLGATEQRHFEFEIELKED